MTTGHSVETQKFLTKEPIALSSYALTSVAPSCPVRFGRLPFPVSPFCRLTVSRCNDHNRRDSDKSV